MSFALKLHCSADDLDLFETIGDGVDTEVIALICDCCQNEMPPHEYAEHLKAEANKCLKKSVIPRTWDCWYRRQEIPFLKTKVVFPNGLVLFHQNVIATDFGNHRRFKRFTKKIYELLKDQFEIPPKAQKETKPCEDIIID